MLESGTLSALIIEADTNMGPGISRVLAQSMLLLLVTSGSLLLIWLAAVCWELVIRASWFRGFCNTVFVILASVAFSSLASYLTLGDAAAGLSLIDATLASREVIVDAGSIKYAREWLLL